MRARLRPLTTALVLLLAATALRAGAESPDPPPTAPAAEERTGPWIEEADPELKEQLAEAEKAAAEGRWPDAALTWQTVLDAAPPRLVPVRRDLPNTFGDVREVVRIRLSTLPAEGLEAYRRLSEPPARKLFAKALRDRDEGALDELWRRFSATSFGPRALLVLADSALRRGEIHVALARLETLAYYDPDGKASGVDAGAVLLRRAYCRARRGEREELAALRAQAAAREGATVALAGRTVLLVEAVDALAAAPADASDPSAWPMAGGRTSRDRPGRATPGRLVWQSTVRARERPEREEERLPDRENALTGRTAVVAGGVAYVKDGNTILRIPLAEDAPRLDPIEELDKLGEGGSEALDSRRIHPAAVANGRLYVVHESDGAGDLASLLLGIDLESDGLQMWVRGGGREGASELSGERGSPRNHWDDPFYADFCFAGSPVTWGDRLFVAGAIHAARDASKVRKIGAHLLCLDARPGQRGRTLWKRLVGYGTPPDEEGDGNRDIRLDPGSPAIRDGVVYLSTNLGAVAALDALTGEILWLHRYRRAGSGRVQGDVVGGGNRWRTDFPVVTRDAVFFAPRDCDRLLVYAPRVDRATGQVLRSERIRRSFPGAEIEYEDLVGAARGILVLSGRAATEGHPIEARKLWPDGPGDRREDVWIGDLPEERVTGRGYLTATHAVVPTRKGIYAFPLEGDGTYRALVLEEDLDLPVPDDGRPVRVFGNLTPAGDHVVSVTPDGVFVFRVLSPDGGPDESGREDRRR